MHVFLTGERNIGKTTLIDGIITLLRSERENTGFLIGGFRTYFEEENIHDDKNVYMISADPDLKENPRVAVSQRDPNTRSFKAHPHIFDSFGVSLLDVAKSSNLIIMDELGFMESEAHLFKAKVFEILNEDIPVLGVVKPPGHEFTDAVRRHPKIKLIEVTEYNREDLSKVIMKELFSYVIHI